MEEAEGRKRIRPEGHETCNLISIEELPENYFEHMGIHVEPRPGALLMEASQPIMLIQEGIVEEASDEEESSEQITTRLMRGKWAHKETTITMDPPYGITRTVTATSERLINPTQAHQTELKDAEGLAITEMEKTSKARADLDPKMPPMVERAGAAEDTIPILVDPNDPSKVLRIGSNLSPDLREDLAHFLKENLDVFAWSHSDMIGIDPNVMCHRLNLDPKKKGVRQKRRPISGERAEALREEVDRLMEVGLLREAFYPVWLANPVLVKKPNDQEHTSFITDRGLYCYIGMPFGLLNAGATYPRLVNKMFKHQSGKTMEAYVDDMLVKSKEARDHVRHLAEMFQILREYRMKLNPQKCVFGVESGKFLGFIVNHRGIEANPAKIQALLEMRSPRRVKDVQSLTGRVAALNRFVSKSSDKCQEFFKAIKGVWRNFKWTEECEEAFQNIKKHLSSPPILSNPKAGETLILYLAVSDFAISAVLVREEDGVQLPVDYKPRTAIKGQALADFMLEFSPHQEVEPGALVVLPSTEEVGLERQNSAPWWSLYVDGASNGDGAGAGIELISPEAHKIRRATHLAFHATNNDAEYEALINGLKLALEMKVENLNVFSDSMIVVYQINGGYQAKGPRTELYLKCAQRIIARFNEVRLELIPRGQNEGADELAMLGSRRESTLLGTVPLDIQRQPTVPEHEVGSLSNELGPTWMTSILAYIREGSLPDEKNEARRIKYKAARYVIYDEILYRRGFSVPLLKCIHGEECNYILRELEEKKGAWPEELAQVLWSYNTTPRTTTGETPFSLVYGCEAMVPVEVGAGSFRRDNYDSQANEVNHRLYLDMIEETREEAQIRIAAYQQRTARHYNSKVRARTFKVGDLVLRRVMPNTKVLAP
ncbi:uncharacterized protein LOC141665323 [Apium graveolens]|uniref:uncharacterized protein LOC141665323 n=1 Tax=Apium graveolens TaxID=4045 RepID=UPI003D79E0B3